MWATFASYSFEMGDMYIKIIVPYISGALSIMITSSAM